MSIKPIDMQINIHKTGDYLKEIVQQNNRPAAEQFSYTMEFQHQIKRYQHSVVFANKVYYRHIDNNTAKEKFKRPDNKKERNGKKNKKEPTRQKTTCKGCNIDIQI